MENTSQQQENQNEEINNNTLPNPPAPVQPLNLTAVKKRKLPIWFGPSLPLTITTILFIAAIIYTQGDCNQLTEPTGGECVSGWLWLVLMPIFMVLFMVSTLVSIIWGVVKLKRVKKETQIIKQETIKQDGKNPGELFGLIGLIGSFFAPIVSIAFCIEGLRRSRQAGYGNPLAWAGIIVNIIFVLVIAYFLFDIFQMGNRGY